MKNVKPSEAIQHLTENATSAMVRSEDAAFSRRDDFNTDLEMMLTGYGVDPDARADSDRLLDEYWNNPRRRNPLLRRLRQTERRTRREVIIGSGFHAATYAAIRVARGFPKPIVVDQANHVGGVFAMTERPVFHLNSSNRPGGAGFVGDLDGQPNYLPGAPVQPANVTAADFQTNADMAWVIRMSLAQNAEVLPGFKITKFDLIESYETGYTEVPAIYSDDDSAPIWASRVIDARGLGAPRDKDKSNGKTIMTFPEFMIKMGEPWPLRGVRRVAVIGDGDAARVSVEQLLGIGPAPAMSMAVDHVQLVDWYAENIPTDARTWRDKERTRYLGISKFLKDGVIGTRRLRVFNRRGYPIDLGAQALVDSRAYDLVIMATGWRLGLSKIENFPNLFDYGDRFRLDDERVVGRYTYGVSNRAKVWAIGPAASIGFSSSERVDGIEKDSNRYAMARLGPRTAALAATLTEPATFGLDAYPLAA